MPNRELNRFVPLAAKFAVITGLIVAVMALITGVLINHQQWRDLLKLAASQAETLAVAGAESIEADDAARVLRSANPTATPQWQKIGETLGHYRAISGNTLHLTALVPVGRDNAQVAVSTDDNYPSGLVMALPGAARRLADPGGNVLLASSRHTESHSNGITRCISAYAAIATAQGRLGAIVSVDVPISTLKDAFETRVALTALVTVIAAVAGVVLAGFIGSLATAPIGELVATARRAASGDLDHAVRVHSHDEIGLLAAAFERMRLALKKERADGEPPTEPPPPSD